MTPKAVHDLVLSFPEVEEGTSYGYPAYKAFGKFFTRIRQDETSVVLGGVGFDERDMLIEAAPETFYVIEHYRNYPYVLARIEALEPEELRGFLTRRWRELAPKRWLKAYDAAKA